MSRETDEILAFVRAELDVDENTAKALHHSRCDGFGPGSYGPDAPCDCDWHVSRMLSEVDVKRCMLLRIEEELRYVPRAPLPNFLLRHMALPFRGREDYQERWRP